MPSRSSSIRTTQFVVPPRLERLASVRQLVLDFTQDTALSKDDAQDLILAVMEAVTNAIKHSESSRLTIIMSADSYSITVKVVDQGLGFDFNPDKCEFPDMKAQSGRGIPLMGSLTDSLEVKSQLGQGTEVTLVKRVSNKDKCLMKAQLSG